MKWRTYQLTKWTNFFLEYITTIPSMINHVQVVHNNLREHTLTLHVSKQAEPEFKELLRCEGMTARKCGDKPC